MFFGERAKPSDIVGPYGRRLTRRGGGEWSGAISYYDHQIVG